MDVAPRTSTFYRWLTSSRLCELKQSKDSGTVSRGVAQNSCRPFCSRPRIVLTLECNEIALQGLVNNNVNSKVEAAMSVILRAVAHEAVSSLLTYCWIVFSSSFPSLSFIFIVIPRIKADLYYASRHSVTQKLVFFKTNVKNLVLPCEFFRRKCSEQLMLIVLIDIQGSAIKAFIRDMIELLGTKRLSCGTMFSSTRRLGRVQAALITNLLDYKTYQSHKELHF